MPKLVNKKPVYVGADPGQRGAVVFLKTPYDYPFWIHWPDTERDLYDLLDCATDVYVGPFQGIIEHVHSFPGQGVTSMFKFGMNYGLLRMALIAVGIPFEEKTPHTWQKGLGIPKRKKDETQPKFKKRLKARAQQLFPKVEVTGQAADAILIAEYCRRLHTGVLQG